MDDTGRDQPGGGEPGRDEPDRDDPDRPGWAAPPPPPGAQPPWAGEPTAPTPPAPPGQPTEPTPAWGTQPPSGPQPPAWGAQPPPPGPPPPPAQPWGTPPPPPAWGASPAQQAWGAPPPQQPAGWNAPPTPTPPTGKRRGWTWLWLLIVGLVVLSGVAIAAIVVAVGAFTKPADATNAYLRDLRAEQYAAAYAHLCDARRTETSFDEFRAQQQSRTSEDPIDTFDVYSSVLHGSGDTATTRYTIDRGLSRERWEVDLVKEGGQWRLCQFTQLRY